MATNKGLLIGAALANGVNAFLDAREKGDLQRQRQALATVEQQMKQQQLANLQQVGQLQGMKIAGYDESVKHERDMERLMNQARYLREVRLGRTKSEDKIDPKEQQFLDVFSQKIPQGDMTKEQYDAHIGDIAFDKDHPYQTLALIYLGMASPSQILSNMGEATVQGQKAKQGIDKRDQELELLRDKVAKKDNLPAKVKTDMIAMFQGAGKVNPDLAKQLAGLKTYKDLQDFWGSDDVVNIILNTRNPELFKAPDGSIRVYDKNAASYDDEFKSTLIFEAEEKYEGIEANDVIALQGSVTSNKSKWETAYAGAYREVATKFRQFSNMLEEFNNGNIDATTFDIALITDFRKLLDKDSVVRESEFAIVRRLQPAWNRLLTIWEAEIKARGGTLIDSSRQSLVNATRAMMEGIQDEYIEQYEASAAEGGTAWSMMNRFKVLEGKYDAETYERIRPKTRELLGEKPVKVDISNYVVTRYTDSKKEDVPQAPGGLGNISTNTPTTSDADLTEMEETIK